MKIIEFLEKSYNYKFESLQNKFIEDSKKFDQKLLDETIKIWIDLEKDLNEIECRRHPLHLYYIGTTKNILLVMEILKEMTSKEVRSFCNFKNIKSTAKNEDMSYIL